MITKIEALNYRCLKYVSIDLLPFQILVGANASGKSTFLDVVTFLSDLIKERDVDAAVRRRSSRLDDLFFEKKGDRFELAVEISIPEGVTSEQANGKYNACRYEVGIGRSQEGSELQIQGETLWLYNHTNEQRRVPPRQIPLFPEDVKVPSTLLQGQTPSGWRKVVNKITKTGNDYFRSEKGDWNNQFRIGSRKSALANVPEDKDRFPISTWVKSLLIEGIQRLALDVKAIRQPCSPIVRQLFLPDGSNLPLVVRNLREKNPRQFQRWLDHVRTVLSDVRDITVVERLEDRHLYLTIEYVNDLKVSSWLLSDGTLRFLVLTLLPYISAAGQIYLIEEPENGIHPLAIQSVFQSLSSVDEGQVLIATHSPLILALANRRSILCFAKTSAGATDIVNGENHPALRDWKGQETLDVLYASGVLG